jgi:hypothetical protein
MFMKRLLIATALTMCAAGAYASNFRGADQVYIPTAGRIVQATNNTFISDVQLANLTSDTVVVSVIYQPINAVTNPANPASIGQEFKDIITLLPFERKEYKDFFQSALHLNDGFGMLILNGCLQGANCGPSGTDDEANTQNYRAISAESRIYSFKTLLGKETGTVGQLFSGIPWYNFVSMLQAQAGLDEIFITGISHTANGTSGFRSNIGLINASEFSNTTLAVQLWQGAARVGNEFTVTLGPLGNTQILVGREIGAGLVGLTTGTNLWATIEQRNSTPRTDIQVPETCLPDGCPAFLAYGSVLDNVSGDATTLEAQYMKALSRQAIEATYPTGAGKPAIRRSARR